ncbi:unnamed protein product [Eruca vesicaria subsp. sativa]|uniref:Uncharacterized protein n=1 Tax=Eruca vesicaria subsp. sativa TaxID=29727 RepID=A0ABC8K1C3_ERUVS|nr:unnamed protein product [Eruca vesicaria subsp. sativa]
MVKVETESTWQPKFQLSVAVLRSCSLEKIPWFLMYQKNLSLVDLSYNRLSGHIPTWLLENNQQLEVLQLQNNSFTLFQMPTTIVHNLKVLDISTNGIESFPDTIGRSLPNMVTLNGSSNGFKGYFPSSIGEMKNLSFLDLSYNNFSGKLPRSFVMGCVSLKYLKLSHNTLSGHFLPRESSFTSLSALIINNNLFTGKIGDGLINSSSWLFLLDMSNNFLTGGIPSWISKTSLQFLMLSNNLLQGAIPPSLLVMTYLDISGNLFSGALPAPDGYNFDGCNLFLQNNNFTGTIPDTFLDWVLILDLSNNKLSGSIPQFVNNTQDISILLLRGNDLTGSIPRELCDLSNIKLLDLSNNKLNGSIPSCLYNLSLGRGGEEEKASQHYRAYIVVDLEWEFYKSTTVVENFMVHYFATFQEIQVKFATKKRYDSYAGRSEFGDGILDYMYGMDLSNNELSGAIPLELGNLTRLRALNLSNNFLLSSIPSSFSGMKDIESLDLSCNKLQGSIPQELTSLTFLVVFDVSHNNLSGIIPQGTQFNTFNENRYSGNPFLCGPPTNRICDSTTKGSDDGRDEEDNEGVRVHMLVFYYTTASTFLAALIGILVLLCFDCPWRRAWFRIVDAFIASAKNLFP